MSSDSVVIIGAGPAGARAAEALRQVGWDGQIHLISKEKQLPYERPAVSKAMIFGGRDGRANFDLWSKDLVSRLAADFHGGVAVEHIDRGSRSVLLAGRPPLAYRHLIIATGARPRRLQVAQTASDGVFYLRTAEDAQRFRRRLETARRLVVVGAGLIGLEVAAGAALAGISVTVVEATNQILSRAVPREISQSVRQMHAANNVEIRLQAIIEGIEGQAGDMRVRLRGGGTIDCDTILVAIGADPNLELAQAAGLSADRGILVDEGFATSDPHIYAAGDVCSFVHPLFGERMRLESWQNAEDQGRHVARTIAGHREPYAAVPWFWSEQFDCVLHVAGVTNSAIKVQRPAIDGDRLFFYLNQTGRLVGMAAFGSAARIGRVVSVGRRLIAAQASPDPTVLADGGADLAALLRH